ncbi:hypothetical protein PMI17_01863 [Pantoea sp. GM01]|nr:hypothetical protein PMI17_01863 [Pantoea sp. GM01]
MIRSTYLVSLLFLMCSTAQAETINYFINTERTAFRVDRLVGIVDDHVDIELRIIAQTKMP